jgi:hypothetical protein
VDRHLYQGASLAKRNEHSLADPDELRALVSEAGFRSPVVETVRKTVQFPSTADYVRIQFAATPLAALVADHDAERTEQLVAAVADDISEALAPYTSDAGLAFPQEVHVVRATT